METTKSSMSEIDNIYKKLLVDDENSPSLKSKIDQINNDLDEKKTLIEEKTTKIQNFYSSIFNNTDESDSIENQINEVLSEVSESRDELDDYCNKLL